MSRKRAQTSSWRPPAAGGFLAGLATGLAVRTPEKDAGDNSVDRVDRLEPTTDQSPASETGSGGDVPAGRAAKNGHRPLHVIVCSKPSWASDSCPAASSSTARSSARFDCRRSRDQSRRTSVTPPPADITGVRLPGSSRSVRPVHTGPVAAAPDLPGRRRRRPERFQFPRRHHLSTDRQSGAAALDERRCRPGRPAASRPATAGGPARQSRGTTDPGPGRHTHDLSADCHRSGSPPSRRSPRRGGKSTNRAYFVDTGTEAGPATRASRLTPRASTP